MPETVIVGVDAHPATSRTSSQDAIALARRLAAPGARLLCVFVLTDRESHVAQALDAPADDVLRTYDDGRGDLTAALFEARTVAGGLHEAARRHHASLIALGSARHGTLGRILAGDDARATLRHAPVPVAVAPRGYHETDMPLDRVGVGHDSTLGETATLEAARRVAGPAGATVTALDVISLTPVGSPEVALGRTLDDEVRDAQARIDALAETGVGGRVVTGQVVDELERFAGTVDLLVVGASRYGRLGRLVTGSTAEALLHHLPVPLLVVPREPAPEAQPASPDDAAATT